MKKPIYKKWWFWVIVLVILGGIGSQLGDKEPKKTGEVSDPKSGEVVDNKKPSEFKVGDIIEKEKLYKVSVNKVTYKASDSSEFVKATEGKELVYLDLTIENLSDEEMAISSMMSFELKDSDGRKQDYKLVTDLNGQLDGKVLQGEKMSGEIVYEVEKEKPINFYMTLGNIFTESPIKVVIR